jgi:hypothetical protein
MRFIQLCDELPGERDLDRVAVLIERVQPGFGNVAGSALRDGNLPGHQSKASDLRCACVRKKHHFDRLFLSDAPRATRGLLKRVG